MKGKQFNRKKGILLQLAGIFTLLSCISIGFATWVSTGSTGKDVSGIFEIDQIEEKYNEIEIFDNISINNYNFAENYGFLNTTTKKYSMTATLSGSCRLNIARASELILSMSSSKQLLLSFGIYSSYTDFGSRFSSSSITLSQTNITINQQTSITSANDIISKTFVITVPNEEYVTIGFSFNITCSNGGKTPGQVGYFPNLSTYPISIKLTPGEAS